MAENQKYYYMRLKENFFDSDEMIALQNMKNGYLYSDILLKLYLRSLRQGGRLMITEIIPYDEEMIAKITNHSKKIVENALKNFKKLNLIEVLDSGAIYMTNIQDYIGKTSTEADRKRNYRNQIDSEKSGTFVRTFVRDLSQKCPPEPRDKRLEIRDKRLEDKEQAASASPSSLSPSLEDIKKYCLDNGLKTDPVHFWRFNEARDWSINGKHITNWKGLLSSWEKSERAKPEPPAPHVPSYGSAAELDKLEPSWMKDMDEMRKSELPYDEGNLTDLYYSERGL